MIANVMTSFAAATVQGGRGLWMLVGILSAAFLLTVVQMFLLARRWPGFLAARAMGVLLGIGIIPVLYYTYLGAWGKQITWFNIAIYAIAVLAAFLLEQPINTNEIYLQLYENDFAQMQLQGELHRLSWSN